ncbi:hypothetical protein M422DRAFT_255838 [Sphaerobolus stellatus SS14]|uniref:Uncharacterized protein n=1 Tax=Sphaerobolus stellatus (strain SS14) TaxID=990650 RepID=A0A0C9VIJ8_SPHS4|nr:hypothetical protein M422DRAFT_255838 [Sphaerobolus stellatus SS14]
MSAVLHRQTELSEQLLLLYELGYSDKYMHHFSGTFNFQSRPDLSGDLRMLNIIAVCLTSGRPGDVVAAAFDKCEGVCLVLAKHGPVLPEDETTTHTFFSQVKAASSWMDLLPFLFSHSKANIEKQCLRLSQTTTDLFSDLQLEIATYLDKSESMEDEFPKSKAWRRFLYKDRPMTIKCILEDVLHICRDESSTFNAQTNKASYTEYARVYGAAYILLHSRFLDMLTGVSNHNIRLKLRAEKLKRRLGKVCQYSRIDKLIKGMKRFPDIPFRWLRDDLKGTGEGVLENCGGPIEVIERIINVKLSIDPSTHAFTPNFA